MPEQTRTFAEKWDAVVNMKSSILCAGLDPADFEMGRTEKGEGLPKGANKYNWALRYIEAVSPYVAGIKPNIQYWKQRGNEDQRVAGDMEHLAKLVEFAHGLGLIVIEDSKLADIGSTNDSGLFYAQDKDFDAVTYSPFAGNMQEATEQAHARNLGIIGMCLMSNPEFKRVKNQLVDISEDWKDYPGPDIIDVGGKYHTRKYIQLAHDSQRFGLDGIVVGAPSSKNHIQESEIERVANYFKGLVLVPGIGAQGGEAQILFKYFSPKNLIINASRGLMFPKGSESTPEQQAEAAKQYRDMLNDLRSIAA